MSIYGTPTGGQPDDPHQPPSYPPPAGYPPPTGQPPPGYPPSPDYPPPTGQPPAGYPPLAGQPPAGYPPPGGAGHGQPGDAAGTGWGQPPSSGGPYQAGTGYGAPSGPATPYGPTGAPYGPSGAPPKSGRGLKIGLIVGGIVLLLFCVCAGAGVWWLVDRAGDDSGPGVGAPTPAGSAGSSPSRPAGTPSSDRYAKGDCLVNDGTDDDPELRKVPCGPDTYEVLSRIPFTTDASQCRNDPVFGSSEADANYVQDDPLDLGDYVLCLKRR